MQAFRRVGQPRPIFGIGTAGDEGEGRHRKMFERFTERARLVVVTAQEEARRLDHDYVGTEHLLLGLTGVGDGLAVKVLESLGISLAAIRQRVEESVDRGEQAPSGHIRFTSQAKTVLELSLREAQALGDSYIGTEHILLGLIREGDGVAAHVLLELGADLARTRVQVTRLLEEHRRGHGNQAG
jgi:ATP-dependent Clp protease ATP-binding subunit ClpC